MAPITIAPLPAAEPVNLLTVPRFSPFGDDAPGMQLAALSAHFPRISRADLAVLLPILAAGEPVRLVVRTAAGRRAVYVLTMKNGA